MHLNAHLDIELVAVEQEDEVALMLELTAPPAPADRERAPATLEVVLDRSGSMGNGQLAAALTALDALVARLDPTDRFGLVTFDDEVEVAVPAGPLTDKQAVREALRRIEVGGTTNLSGGYFRGIQEAGRAADGAGATLLLLSDGHANQGLTDASVLETIASKAHGHGVTTTTLELGLGYDEVLMAGVARGGSGGHHFAEEGDTAGRLIASEVDGLLSVTAQAASLIVRPTSDVAGVRLWNELPAAAIDGGVMIELGDLYAGETRKLVLTLAVPAMPALGLVKVADLELRYVELPAATEHEIKAPVHVNVVPGDEAAGRIPDPTVRSELTFQQAQDAKRRASEALRRGEAHEAAQMYGEGRQRPERGDGRRPARYGRGHGAGDGPLAQPRRSGYLRRRLAGGEVQRRRSGAEGEEEGAVSPKWAGPLGRGLGLDARSSRISSSDRKSPALGAGREEPSSREADYGAL